MTRFLTAVVLGLGAGYAASVPPSPLAVSPIGGYGSITYRVADLTGVTARVRPHVVDGVRAGMVIDRIQTGSLYDRLGYRDGDLIEEATGQPVRWWHK